MKSRYAFLLLITTVAITPLVLMVFGSIKAPMENLRIPPTFLPKAPTFENYVFLLKYPIGNWLLNTLVVCGGFTAINLLITVFFGFSNTFRNGLYQRFLARGAIFSMFLGTETMLIPRYLLMRSLGLFNTRLGMILPFLPIPTYGLLLTIYLRSFPKDLVDAAEMDGCGVLRQIFHVIIPNTRPYLAVVGFMSFLTVYDMLMWQSLVAPKTTAKTLPVGLALVVVNDLSNRMLSFPNFSINLASATVAFIPLFIVFLLSRKYFKSYTLHQGVSL